MHFPIIINNIFLNLENINKNYERIKMKNIALILSVIFAMVVACETTPKKTTPEQSAGLKLPNGVSVRETPRGSVLNLANNREVKFSFDRTVEIGSYEDAYNLVYQVINDNPSIRIMVEGNSSKEGRARYNYNLSQRRADKSYNYLIKLGTQNSKLLKNAFGEALPEYTELESNRRSEFIIIMNEDDLKKYNDFAKTLDVNKEVE